MKKFMLLGLVLVNLALLSGAASAKYIPYVEPLDADWGDFSSPFLSPGGQQFSGLYGRLASYGDVDVIAVDLDAPQKNFMVEALALVCGQHFEGFEPSVALIGPGLESSPKATFPFELPKGAGAVLVTKEVDQQPENNAYFGGESQSHVLDQLSIPDAGTYYVAVWESNGNTGAYVVSTGSVHPESIDSQEAVRMTREFELINSGQWMGQDCNAPLAVEDCPPTPGHRTRPNDAPPALDRAKVGEGYVLTGGVRDTSTCLPIVGAKITLWVRNEAGEYDDDHFATIYTNQQGLYRFDSNFPGGPDPHIHIHISAPGYQAIVLEHIPESQTSTSAEFPIALRPE